MYEIACRIAFSILGRCYKYFYLSNKKEPSISLDGGIAKEVWTIKKIRYSFLKSFNCEAFVHFNKENITNLDTKSKKCTFIEYGINAFGYHLNDYETHKIIRIRDVVFKERVLYKDQL